MPERHAAFRRRWSSCRWLRCRTFLLGDQGRFVGGGGAARLALDHLVRAERLAHLPADFVVQRHAPEDVFRLQLAALAQVFGVRHGLFGRVRQFKMEGDVAGNLFVAADHQAGLEDLGVAEREARLRRPKRI